MESETVILAAEGRAGDWEEAIWLSGSQIVDHGFAQDSFIRSCIEREREYPTGIPSEIPVAIPHSKSDSIRKNCMCFLKLEKPVVFRRMDDDDRTICTRVLFTLALRSDDHLRFLQRLIKFVTDAERVKLCCKATLEDVPSLLDNMLG